MEEGSCIMATKLNIAAQYAMDSFLKTYRVTTDFVDLQDFIFHAAASAAAIYQALYEREYAKQRADGEKDSVVAFSNDFLSSQVLKVENKDGEVFATLKEGIFSFAYDQSQVGCQNVFCFTPKPQYEIERSDVDELWQLQYLPFTNRNFWALDGERILIIQKGICNIKEIKVLYVPQVNADNPETLLPDGIVKAVIDSTVNTIRELGQGKIVKKTNDLNENAVPATEINQPAAKP
jgi:hypothetical protein